MVLAFLISVWKWWCWVQVEPASLSGIQAIIALGTAANFAAVVAVGFKLGQAAQKIETHGQDIAYIRGLLDTGLPCRNGDLAACLAEKVKQERG
jgi:hypothetical protein